MPTIQFLEGSLEHQTFEVDEDGAVFGSGRDCELQLKDRGVSTKHAQLELKDGTWVLEDLKSRTGTRVNQQEGNSHELKEGDIIHIGEASFRFHLDFANHSEQSPPKTAATATREPDPSLDVPDEPELSGVDKATIDELKDAYNTLREELGSVIVGQQEVIEQVLVSIFCRSHALLVGVPGLAKTLLVSTLSEVLELSFKRVQFTPDLMPSDITGTEVLEEDHTTGKRVFRFVQGPIFANMILADEINRTPPKTQASLLEAMQERHVTVGEETMDLPKPFFVLATQNPIEQEGTYPLPEAQLDRFMFNIKVGYPTEEEERAIIKRVSGTYTASLNKHLNAEEVLRLQDVVRRVPAADHVISHAATLARATRPGEPEAPDFVKDLVSWGAGPRAGIYLILAAKARAILYGRYHVTTGDVNAVAYPVLRHRVITTFNAEAAGVTSDDVIRMLIDHFRPTEKISV